MAGLHSEMSTVRSFLEWASDNGLEFGLWNGDKFVTANKGVEQLLSDHFGINQEKIEAERRAMLAALSNQ